MSTRSPTDIPDIGEDRLQQHAPDRATGPTKLDQSFERGIHAGRPQQPQPLG